MDRAVAYAYLEQHERLRLALLDKIGVPLEYALNEKNNWQDLNPGDLTTWLEVHKHAEDVLQTWGFRVKPK